jgi:two-component system chemotaxis sensor kinase CheA
MNGVVLVRASCTLDGSFSLTVSFLIAMKHAPTQHHVMVVEDDAVLADIMEKTLREHDVRVTVCRNGEEAITALLSSLPDLLLLDMLMPNVDGFGVLQTIQERKWFFPIVMISNISDRMTKEKCKKLGASAYIVKSDVDADELWLAVEKYLH